MSLDLRDVRAKLSIEGDCALEAESRVTGKDKSQLIREIVDEWAKGRIHAATVLLSLLQREGVGAASEGAGAASQGAPGRTRA